MVHPFDGLEVDAEFRPSETSYKFDLAETLSAVVALEASIPPDAFTANALGTERIGNGAVISASGLVVTAGYLVTEAETVTLTLGDGRRVVAHVLGADTRTGFGLVQALEPLDVTPLALGDASRLTAGSAVMIAGAGGRRHAIAGQVLTRMTFAGYWEYLLEDAIMTEPAHPHWSGAALIDSRGALVGVGSLTLQRRARNAIKALNMFIPVDLLPPILDDLAHGRSAHPPRPWLGVLAQDIGDHVELVGISPRGPAERAELRQGDKVLAIGGEPVADLEDFYGRLWAQGPAGAIVPLTLQRDEDVFHVEVRSGDRSAFLRKPRLH